MKEPDQNMNAFKNVRDQFPYLHTIEGRAPIYFDTAATSQKPQVVIDSIAEYYSTCCANIHRGAPYHSVGKSTTDLFENVRFEVAAFLNASGPETIIFTRGTTESINIVAACWGKAHVHPGDRIIVTVAEHHSNLLPWKILAQSSGAELVICPIDQQGIADQKHLAALLEKPAKIAAFTHVSNVLGVVNPINDMTALCHERGTLVLVDAAQSAPMMPIDVTEIGCDFLAFSGHKACAPNGIGVLYCKKECLDTMVPRDYGGGMVRKVLYDGIDVWREGPGLFEAGTPPIAEVIGLGAALRYLKEIGLDNIQKYETSMVRYFCSQITKIPSCRLLGESEYPRSGVVSIVLPKSHIEALVQVLNAEGIYLRAGTHCAQPLHNYFGIESTLRASFYLYNSFAEIDILLDVLDRYLR